MTGGRSRGFCVWFRGGLPDRVRGGRLLQGHEVGRLAGSNRSGGPASPIPRPKSLHPHVERASRGGRARVPGWHGGQPPPGSDGWLLLPAHRPAQPRRLARRPARDRPPPDGLRPRPGADRLPPGRQPALPNAGAVLRRCGRPRSGRALRSNLGSGTASSCSRRGPPAGCCPPLRPGGREGVASNRSRS